MRQMLHFLGFLVLSIPTELCSSLLDDTRCWLDTCSLQYYKLILFHMCFYPDNKSFKILRASSSEGRTTRDNFFSFHFFKKKLLSLDFHDNWCSRMYTVSSLLGTLMALELALAWNPVQPFMLLFFFEVIPSRGNIGDVTNCEYCTSLLEFPTPPPIHRPHRLKYITINPRYVLFGMD